VPCRRRPRTHSVVTGNSTPVDACFLP
jgi:hypothetical protein